MSTCWYGVTLLCQALNQKINRSTEVDLREATRQMEAVLAVPEEDIFKRFQATELALRPVSGNHDCKGDPDETIRCDGKSCRRTGPTETSCID